MNFHVPTLYDLEKVIRNKPLFSKQDWKNCTRLDSQNPISILNRFLSHLTTITSNPRSFPIHKCNYPRKSKKNFPLLIFFLWIELADAYFVQFFMMISKMYILLRLDHAPRQPSLASPAYSILLSRQTGPNLGLGGVCLIKETE